MNDFSRAKREAFEVGMRENKAAWRGWKRNHFRVLLPWLTLSILIALLMLGGIWLVATHSNSMAEQSIDFLTGGSPIKTVVSVFINNCLVLLLHLLVCVAAYLARRSVPLQAKHLSGLNRFVHNHMGGIAMAVVSLMVLYSLGYQTWEIGQGVRQVSNFLDLAPAALLMRLAPHALIELTAVFLPLAACLLLGRKEEWNSLLAATLLTAVVALPMIVVAALWEGFVAASLF